VSKQSVASRTRPKTAPRTSRPTGRRRAARPAPWWRRWGWVAGLVAVAAVVGIVVQSSRTGGLTVVQPAHPVGASGAEVLGTPTAPVLVEEYGDFQCPACASWERTVFSTVQRLVDEGRIRFAYYPFAFLGPESQTAASAAVCAADQGKFWEYRAVLYANQFPENSGALTASFLVDAGAGLGITGQAFERCVRDGTYAGWIQQVSDGATARGVVSTPTVLVGGKGFAHPPTAEELVAAVESAGH
jgi:protein-disulfide isomerase